MDKRIRDKICFTAEKSKDSVNKGMNKIGCTLTVLYSNNQL